MAPLSWTIADADVLRALELHFSGERRHKSLLARMPQLDALDVSRIFNAKFAPLVLEVVERHPQWQAEHPVLAHTLQKRRAGLAAKREDADEGDDVGAYEAKRLQRIRENQQVLAALGIDKPAPKRVKRASAPSAEDKANVTRRRSTRISEVSAARTVAAEAEALRIAEQDRLWKLARRVSRRSQRVAPLGRPACQALDVPVVDLTVEPEPALPAPRLRLSSQELAIDLESFHARWLGRQLWPKGKQTVMQGVCPGHTPRFSKMSGVQPWKNAVLLFVNVHEGAAAYDNAFHHVPSPASPPLSTGDEPTASAVYFRWFAQQRQHLESPVIQRLLQAQEGDARLRLADSVPPARPAGTADAAGHAPEEPVLLFLRHVDGPYIYCGRLGLLGVRADASPLEFRWQLLDAAALAWDKIKTLVEAASAPVDGAAVVVEDA
ncbi:hypothetical protein PybrP1_002979 [[Pythium] brassicae (nom. inval.)]|nr:hypothetical protein PybrP1_002979 [[Pythium] brassicae (nom. inval.)]